MRLVVLWEILILLSGVSSGVVGAVFVFLIGFMLFQHRSGVQLFQYNFLTFLTTIILADNYKNSLIFYQYFSYFIVVVIFIYYNKNAYSKLTFAIIPFVVAASFSSIFGGQSDLIDFFRIAAFVPVIGVVNAFFKTNVRLEKERFLSYFYVAVIIINILLMPVAGLYGNGRYHGVMANPNGLAMVISTVLIGLSFLSDKSDYAFNKKSHYFFVLCGFILLMSSGSRTSLVALLAFYFIRMNGKVYVVNLLPLAMLIVGSLFFKESLPYMRSETVSSFGGRLDVWRISFEEGMKNWLLGGGMGYEDIFLAKYRSAHFDREAPTAYYGIFNSYLSLFVNLGLIGLCTMMFFWIRCFVVASSRKFAIGFLVFILCLAITESYMRASLSPGFPLIVFTWYLLYQDRLKHIDFI